MLVQSFECAEKSIVQETFIQTISTWGWGWGWGWVEQLRNVYKYGESDYSELASNFSSRINEADVLLQKFYLVDIYEVTECYDTRDREIHKPWKLWENVKHQFRFDTRLRPCLRHWSRSLKHTSQHKFRVSSFSEQCQTNLCQLKILEPAKD